MIKVLNRNFIEQAGSTQFSIMCPMCSSYGTFASLDYQFSKNNIGIMQFFGYAMCPNPACSGIVLFLENHANQSVDIYPKPLIPFDSEGVPTEIEESFREALICQSQGCYMAAAVMVRSTIEKICHNKNAKGGNLLKKIENLKEMGLIPTAYLSGMDLIRELGNDSVHVFLTNFENIGKEEVDVAIDITKNIMEFTYRSSLLIERLSKQKIKKTPDNVEKTK